MYPKRLLAAVSGVALAILTLGGPTAALAVPASAPAVAASGMTTELHAESVVDVASDAAPSRSNDELFGGYVYRLFYGNEATIEPLGTTGYEQLTEHEQSIYEGLKNLVSRIAAGDYANTKMIEVSGISYTYNKSELGATTNDDATDKARERAEENLGKIFNALFDDCPYELYWYNKSEGRVMYSTTTFTEETVTLTYTHLGFSVAKSYQADPNSTNENAKFQLDTSKVATAKAAATEAQKIVGSLEGTKDYDRLVAYKNTICGLVDYNYDAAASASADTYGDPWQLVWVFDNDPSTKVVCEGYAKAFQYLCDLTTFTNDQIRCTTVSGTMTGGTGEAANHMWNIVRLDDGKSYLADITNSDEGSIGSDGSRFLVPCTTASGPADKPITYEFPRGEGSTSVYTYGDEDYSLYNADVLNLSSEAYTPSSEGFIDLADASIRLEGETQVYPYVYNGKEHEPKPTVYVDGAPVSESAYTIFYTNNIHPGEATVTITAKTGSSYTGTASKTFQIEPKPLAVSLTGSASKEYDGNTSYNGEGLSLVLDGVIPGEDVSASAGSYAFDTPSVGEELVVNAYGLQLFGEDENNYELGSEGSIAAVSAQVGAITPARLTANMFLPIPTQAYSGSAITPAITIDPGFVIPLSPDDYTVSYQNNVAPGTASVTLTATQDGNYTGSITLTFQIAADAPEVPDDPTTNPSRPGDGGQATSIKTPGAYHVTVSVQDPHPTVGETVTLLPDVDEGYEVRSISVVDEDGNEIPVTQNEDGTWSFEQPEGEVTVKVDSGCDGGSHCLTHAFSDVSQEAWYHDPIDWAVENDVLHGYADGSGLMKPENRINRAEMAAILWNYAGNPDPTGSLTFPDCSEDDWYAQAATWAAETGAFSGYANGAFGPLDVLTREQAAVTLWRAAGEPEVDVDLSQYPDVASVSPFAREAVAWAISEGVLSGREPQPGVKQIAPQDPCSRAEVAAFLMRFDFLEE
ncbi:MAG TPA: S-layer homology domain-containing protein [Candidatus Limicola stercorigallinarum]|nr:S-layer homology domain-containing protein [Candidatus Limicola stercorigallinarum]